MAASKLEICVSQLKQKIATKFKRFIYVFRASYLMGTVAMFYFKTGRNQK